jgi:hypothetical protein
MLSRASSWTPIGRKGTRVRSCLVFVFWCCLCFSLLVLSFLVLSCVWVLSSPLSGTLVVLGLVFRSCLLVLSFGPAFVFVFFFLSFVFVFCQGAALLEKNRHYDALDAYNEGVCHVWSVLSYLFVVLVSSLVQVCLLSNGVG